MTVATPERRALEYLHFAVNEYLSYSPSRRDAKMGSSLDGAMRNAAAVLFPGQSDPIPFMVMADELRGDEPACDCAVLRTVLRECRLFINTPASTEPTYHHTAYTLTARIDAALAQPDAKPADAQPEQIAESIVRKHPPADCMDSRLPIWGCRACGALAFAIAQAIRSARSWPDAKPAEEHSVCPDCGNGWTFSFTEKRVYCRHCGFLAVRVEP